MSWFLLFFLFFRIGLIGFGGGLAMLPMIFQGVQDFGFMSRQEFSNLVALSQITPGPVAVNAATYVGFNYGGLVGAALATLGVALPSFLIMLVIARLVEKYYFTLGVQGVFKAMRPITAGLIAAAALMVAETSLFNVSVASYEFFKNLSQSINLIPAVIFVVSFILISKTKINPMFVMVFMALLGALTC